jgi:D-glycero-alpha-D-manno-heptose-7-phosphate kinase
VIISRTPFRISFAGGGSDLRDYYSRYGGAVLSATINKYVFLSIHPYFFDDKYFLKYSKSEHVDNVDKIEHRIIRQVFRDYHIKGVDFNSSADIPTGTGLGSSSAFAVGLINLCTAYAGKYSSKGKIAEYACEIEIERLKEPIGKQDQYACALGGLNFINFNQDETVVFEKVYMTNENLKQLQRNLMLFYTGGSRAAGDILKEQKKNTSDDNRTVENLHKMVKLASDLKEELSRNNVDALGEILHTGWMYKKELASSITNEKIDYYYELAKNNGASGGKLLGAGGSGFLLFYVKEGYHEQLSNALHELNELKFELDNIGTSIVYYD